MTSSAAIAPGVLGFESVCSICNSRQQVRSDGETFRWPRHQRTTRTGGDIAGLFHWSTPEVVVVDDCPQSELQWEPMSMTDGWTTTAVDTKGWTK